MDGESAVDRLVRAAEDGDASLVARLLGEGVPVDAPVQGGRGLTALDIAVRRGHAEVVRVLIGAGADPHQAVHEYGEFTPLTAAASSGRTDVVAALLDAGVHPDTPSRDGNPLMFAVTSTVERPEIVDLLLDHGSDIHLLTKGRTPLEWASAAGNPQMVQHLLDRGAVPTAKAVRVARTWGNNKYPDTWPRFEKVIDLLRAAGVDTDTAP
ncbi:ankyrin repeat domain-containing protein [Streptomyces sp. NPDC005566]|uniref:ankyrin repeat domain-containing protein n=1 Tax=Streptomyces sp. NPDC005566 TaxID=3156886 RepID=UPI0033B7EC91